MKVRVSRTAFERICGAKYMASLYDPRTQTPEEASACIEQFEFPDIRCAYPVVWVEAVEAAELCAAEGKRVCDAHEWEDACQGRSESPDYRFDLAQGVSPEVAISRMRAPHNLAHEHGMAAAS
jgi:formylglycine-generating enzyme required for sulfatase activity